MKKCVLSLLFFGTLWFTSAAQCPSGRYLNKTFTVVRSNNIVYGANTPASGTGTTNLVLDVYSPAGDTLSQRPLVIFAHGGSFIGGDRNTSDMVDICTALAARGYVCASIEYRLESALALISPTANELMVKEVVRAAQDGKAAVRFFRKDAATTNTYKIDSNQIFFGGTSAGAILALHLAYMQPSDPLPSTWLTWANAIGGFEGTSGSPGHTSNVSAVVSYAGAIGDTSWMNETNIPWTDFHSVDDGTVPDSTGYPLALSTLPYLNGGSMMSRHADFTHCYHEYYRFPGANHPPFADGLTSTWDTIENRTARFLYKNLSCNPEHLTLTINDINFNTSEVLSLFPIPCKNELNIETKQNQQIYNLIITDIQGKEVITIGAKQQNNWKVDVSALKPGIYFVKINVDNKYYMTRIIKD